MQYRRGWFPYLPAVLLAFFAAAGSLGWAIESTVPPPGIRENTPNIHALVNARIVNPDVVVIERGTIVIRDGIITAVGANLPAPADARVWDLDGKTVYPGFIDAYTELSTGGEGRGRSGGGAQRSEQPGTPASKPGANYWNPQVVPQTRADLLFQPDKDANKSLRSQGIAARLVAPAQGVIKGASALVTTGDGDGAATILKDRVAMHAALTTRGGFAGEGGYPDSPMGAYTLVRQAFYDADWYRQAWDAYRRDRALPRPERNDALEAMQGFLGGRAPVIFDASDELYTLRADRVARELGLNAIVRGNNEEYQRLDLVAAAGRPIILPVNFPKAPSVKTPEDALAVSLTSLMHWDIAPENAGRLAKAGVTIAFTSNGLKDTKEFLGGVRKAVARGLDKNAALRALTLAPAQLFGIADRLGSIAVGKAGNLVVASGDIFDDKTEVLETWVDGRRYEVKTAPVADLRGEWTVRLSDQQTPTDTVTLKLKGEPAKLSGSIVKNSKDAKLSEAAMNDARLGVSFKGDSLGWPGMVRMSATKSGEQLLGDGVWSDGRVFTWSATLAKAFVPEPDTSKPKPPQMATYEVIYPMMAFGNKTQPAQQTVLFRNATVWTCGPQGTIENGSVLIQGGKIAAVGQDLAAPAGAVVVDATGKHIAPGIIDCHSHSATDGGINESGQTISAEVRIGDFINPDDDAVYRQLAGGVTAANVLHGSANTIGGQNQIIKMRWGVGPEDLKFEGAPQGIKFALGENVKQSNWGDRFNTRYPQSRMGVEQLVRDEFAAARQYKARWESWTKTKKGIPPRRDLELDAIVEILDGRRDIHCHSYRQDEILALMRVCEDFGVRIKTFQHILEGYKVADVMAQHGVGGSSFSDWWAYKMEVVDAIPYNGALMHNAGVVVSFNSDSNELARRLNTEAAKAMKYGGVSAEDALKFVTLNPAIQLGIQARVGSLEVGKDADLAVWSDSPLSAMVVCEQTWIDGRKYFDREDDARRRAELTTMRATLIQKILDSGDEGEGGGGERKRMWPRHDIFCGFHDDEEEE
jgi:N-acetylglucosamine-6-phosphate deacetylase